MANQRLRWPFRQRKRWMPEVDDASACWKLLASAPTATPVPKVGHANLYALFLTRPPEERPPQLALSIIPIILKRLVFLSLIPFSFLTLLECVIFTIILPLCAATSTDRGPKSATPKGSKKIPTSEGFLPPFATRTSPTRRQFHIAPTSGTCYKPSCDQSRNKHSVLTRRAREYTPARSRPPFSSSRPNSAPLERSTSPKAPPCPSVQAASLASASKASNSSPAALAASDPIRQPPQVSGFLCIPRRLRRFSLESPAPPLPTGDSRAVD